MCNCNTASGQHHPTSGSRSIAHPGPHTGDLEPAGRTAISGQLFREKRSQAWLRARLQLDRRRVEAPIAEGFVQGFAGMSHIPLSIWIPASPSHALKHGLETGFEVHRLAAPPEHFWAGTAPFLGILAALCRSSFPSLGLSAQGTPLLNPSWRSAGARPQSAEPAEPARRNHPPQQYEPPACRIDRSQPEKRACQRPPRRPIWPYRR